MATYIQNGQHVNNQMQGDTLYINMAPDFMPALALFLQEIEHARIEVHRSQVNDLITTETASKVDAELVQAAAAAQLPSPDKRSIWDHIGKAKALLDDATSAVGLVNAILVATEVARRIV